MFAAHDTPRDAAIASATHSPVTGMDRVKLIQPCISPASITKN